MTIVDGASEDPRLPPEPVEFRTHPLSVGARLWCGATTFFFAAFVFAYVYLRSLDTNHGWIIGRHVSPSGGLGTTIVVLLLLSGILWRVAWMRPARTLSAGVFAIALALAAITLQLVEYTTLGFGPASGGYASVFLGWTGCYVLGAICCVYWMETQVATVWRAGRRHLPEDETTVMRAGVEASSFFWAYYVAIGVLTFVILYVV